tara:strand:- start:2402 stop:3373 length:972 start_codon:yes stop_codon:yes gene_type:complete
MIINKKNKIKLLYDMIKIREVENTIARKYSEGKMRCPVHLSIGQEAIAVGVCNNLKKTDQILSAHRSHAHYLAKGGNLNSMISELHGKVTGCAKGKGGSMHLIDQSVGMLAAVPIVGSTLPISVGVAWSHKIKKRNNLVVVFFGDGATEEGVFQESLDFASLHQLRILFICENNYYSVYSNIKKRQNPKRKITKIAQSLGISAKYSFGNNILKVFEESKKAINYINKFKRPFLLEFSTYRTVEHCGPFDDDHLGYRNVNEINYWKKNCPINTYTKDLIKHKIISKEKIKNFENNFQKKIESSFNYAKKSKFPSKKFLKKNIYA